MRKPRIVYHVHADGKLPKTSPEVKGLEVHPLSTAAHFPNEAGIKCFQDFTPLKDEASIKAFRADFIEHLRDYVGIKRVLNADLGPELYDDEPIANTIDLGGGNVLVPYALNDAFNQRVVARVTPNSTTDFPDDGGFLNPGARVRECGFKLQVGRAGISSTAEYVPFGSVVRFGMYVLELPEGDLLMRFKDNFPTFPSPVSHYEMTQTIESDEWGAGHMSGVQRLRRIQTVNCN